jgi:TRAP-type transport system periplasmic protein
MNSRVLIIIALLAVFGTACSRTPVLKSEYRMHVPAGATTGWGLGAARFAKLVTTKTDGRIHIQPYYDGQLCPGADERAARKVAGGEIDLALDSTINLATWIPEMNVFALPFFVGSYERLDRLEEGRTGRRLFEALASRRLTPLAWGENGFRLLTNRKGPVAAPADLRGLTVRVTGNPIFEDIFRALGAKPVSMSWSETMRAMEQGTVDAAETPAEILVAMPIERHHEFLTRWNYAIDPLVLYWNAKQFASFPEDIQRAIRAAAVEACRYEKAYVRIGLDDGTALNVMMHEFDELPPIGAPMAFLASRGMMVLDLTDAQLHDFERALLPVRQRWAKKIGSKVYQAALQDTQSGSARPPP